MDFIIPTSKNSAQAQMASGVSASGTTIQLKTGEASLLPTGAKDSATSVGTSETLNCTGIGAMVSVGDFIRNITDGSVAWILAVSTNSITTTVLMNGSDNTWDSSDEWVVGTTFAWLSKKDASGEDTTRELIKIEYIDTASDQILIETRGIEGTPTAFAADDYVSVYVSAQYMTEISKAIGDLARRKADSADAVLQAVGTSLGDVMQFNGTSWERLAIGTADQVLTSDGTNASWETAATTTELTQGQAEDDTSTFFGTVSGERLGQAIDAKGASFKDIDFNLWNDENYIADAPAAPTISVGGAGTFDATSIKVKLSYKSANGQATEVSAESNELTSIINSDINIPVVESVDPGCTGILIWVDIDGGGYEFWDEVDNADATIVFSSFEIYSVFSASYTPTDQSSASINIAAGTYEMFAVYLDGSVSHSATAIGKAKQLPDWISNGSKYFWANPQVDETANAPEGATHKAIIARGTGAALNYVSVTAWALDSVAAGTVYGNAPAQISDEDVAELILPTVAPVTPNTENKTKILVELDTRELSEDRILTVPNMSGAIALQGMGMKESYDFSSTGRFTATAAGIGLAPSVNYYGLNLKVPTGTATGSSYVYTQDLVSAGYFDGFV